MSRYIRGHWTFGAASVLFISIFILALYYAIRHAFGPLDAPLQSEMTAHHHAHGDPSFFTNLLKVYTPRRVCMFYERPLIWLHLVSDFLIGVAYYSIPVALTYFVIRRKDVAFHWMFWMFALFILACGTTHLIGVLDLWLPFYKVDGLVKAFTAACSLTTAVALWPLIPKAVALPSPAQLEQRVMERTADLANANDALRSEIAARVRMEEERKELLDRERQARGEAERSSRMKDEFLATLSHELRTPLNAILGWTGLLRRDRNLSPEIVRGLEVVERNAKAQANLIEDLLDMSRIISGKMGINLSPINFAAVVEAAVQVVRPTAEIKGVKLSLRMWEQSLPVQGDPGRLQQAVWNLLSNAVKFTPKGGSIHVLLEQKPSEAVLRVQDTGEGMDPAFIPYLFERFRQSDSSITRRHGGLGLGLSIAKHIVDMHGGTISAASGGFGKGSEFTIRLPLAGRHFPQGEESSEKARKSVNLTGITILAVDDDLDALELYHRFFTEKGAHVMTVPSAAESLAAFRTKRPDVMICDIGMPGMDGYELAQRLRALEREQNLPPLPIIAVTAYARPEDTRRALEAGFSAYLSKPLQMEALEDVVAELI